MRAAPAIKFKPIFGASGYTKRFKVKGQNIRMQNPVVSESCCAYELDKSNIETYPIKLQEKEQMNKNIRIPRPKKKKATTIKTNGIHVKGLLHFSIAPNTILEYAVSSFKLIVIMPPHVTP